VIILEWKLQDLLGFYHRENYLLRSGKILCYDDADDDLKEDEMELSNIEQMDIQDFYDPAEDLLRPKNIPFGNSGVTSEYKTDLKRVRICGDKVVTLNPIVIYI